MLRMFPNLAGRQIQSPTFSTGTGFQHWRNGHILITITLETQAKREVRLALHRVLASCTCGPGMFSLLFTLAPASSRGLDLVSG